MYVLKKTKLSSSPHFIVRYRQRICQLLCEAEAIMDINSALKIAAVGTASAVGAYVGGPVVLGAVGFTKAGVAAGSIAAALQTPATAAGSVFALCQSAGVLGLAASTKAGICATAGAVGAGISSILK